ncbi:MAG: hypothetical protein NZ700_18265 [Gemmataceae bacterium]|nr:hypothetical protein [Gemmataceae bacterium]MDW8265481.1 hypothetical protein [Gemmataceae bacterium]
MRNLCSVWGLLFLTALVLAVPAVGFAADETPTKPNEAAATKPDKDKKDASAEETVVEKTMLGKIADWGNAILPLFQVAILVLIAVWVIGMRSELKELAERVSKGGSF